MKNIVALTRAAINLATRFEEFPQYTIYKISKSVKTAKRSYVLEECEHPEEYDKKFPDLTQFFKSIKKEVVFIVCGASLESAASLRILEQLRDRKIYVIYVAPERGYLNEVEKLNEKVVFHVLQEYARSGVFERMYIIDNTSVEKILQDQLTIEDYYLKMNDLICNSIHMINVFENTPSIFQNCSPLADISRIATFAVGSFNDEEKDFFSLDKVEEKDYYFAMSKDKIAEEGLLEKVRDHMKKNSEGTKINYRIYSTEYADDYVYSVLHTSKIQNRA